MSKPVVAAAVVGAVVGFIAAKRMPDEINIRIPYLFSFSVKNKA